MKLVDTIKNTLVENHVQYFRDMEEDPYAALGLGVVATVGAGTLIAAGTLIKFIK